MKKITAIILALVLVLALAACGNSGNDNSSATPAPAENNTPAPAENNTPAPADDDKPAELEKIIVGASSTPHAEILEQVKPVLAEQGYELEIVVYDDYVLPNKALDDGEIDANYFQHSPYLESFNASNGTDLVAATLVH